MEGETIRHVEEWGRPRTVVLLTLLLLAALWTVVVVSVVVARHDSLAATGRTLQQLTHALEEQTRQQFRLIDTVLVASELDRVVRLGRQTKQLRKRLPRNERLDLFAIRRRTRV